MSVCLCGYDWRRISPTVIDDDKELTVVRRMISIWRESAPGYSPLEDTTACSLTREVSTVYPDALCALTDACLFLRNKGRLQATTENELCHRTVISVASALDDWPESFFRFCDEFDTVMLQELQRLWSGYSGGELSETQGWLLVAAALEEHLEGRQSQNGGRPGLKRPLRLGEAGWRLGLDVSKVERLVEQGKLRGIPGIKEKRITRITRITWIDSHSIRRLVREIKRMHPAYKVAMDLGIGLGQLSDLGQYGWLSPDSGPGIDGYDETKFSIKTLDAFLDRISALVTPTHDGSEHNVVPFSRVADHLKLHGLSFGSFMQAMDSGFPRPVIEREGQPGRLLRFWFRIDEINQCLDSQIDPEKRPAAVHHTMPSMSKVVEWLERKQEEFDNRFYHA